MRMQDIWLVGAWCMWNKKWGATALHIHLFIRIECVLFKYFVYSFFLCRPTEMHLASAYDMSESIIQPSKPYYDDELCNEFILESRWLLLHVDFP